MTRFIPECEGSYNPKSDNCQQCWRIDACEMKTKLKKKPDKEEEKPQTDEDKFFKEIMKKAAMKDPVERYYKLYKEAKANGDKEGMQLWLLRLNNALDKDEGDDLKTMLAKKAIAGDDVDKLVTLFDKVGGIGGKSDIEAMSEAVVGSVKEVSETAREVFGRKKLSDVKSDEKYANEFSKCMVCNQIIHHPNPKSCPNCGATADDQPEEIPEPTPATMTPEDEEKEDCFGDYDDRDDECKNCFQSKECRESSESPEPRGSGFEKVPQSTEPLPEGAEDFLDEIHRICEWVQDDVDAKQNTTTFYKLAIGNKIKKGRTPRPKDLAAVKWSLFSAEIGMDKLLEIAAQWSEHPEAQEFQITTIIDTLSTQKGKGFVHASWSMLGALAEQDEITITNEDREKMIDNLNAYSPIIKLDVNDYYRDIPSERGKPKPSKKTTKKKPGKKKSTKKKPAKKSIEQRKKKIAQKKKVDCPMGCGKQITIADMKEHVRDCKGAK